MKVMLAVEMDADAVMLKTHLIGTDDFDATVIDVHSKVCEHLFCDKMTWDEFISLCAYFDVMRGALKEAMQTMAAERNENVDIKTH